MFKKLAVGVIIASLIISGITFIPTKTTAQAPEGFVTPSVTEQVGDIVYITIRYPVHGAETSSIKIGDKKKNGYTIEGQLKGNIGTYDSITVAFDTTTAGKPNEESLKVVYGPEGVSIDVNRETQLENPPIEPDAYSMKVYMNGELYDLGQLNLELAGKPTPVEFTRAQQSASTDEILDTESINRTSVADGDKAVIRINAQGTNAYLPSSTSGDDLEKGGSIDSNHGVYVSLTEVTTEPNSNPSELGLDGVELHQSPGSDQINFVIDTTRYNMSPGDKFRLTFFVRESNGYMPAGEYSQNFSVVEKHGSFYTNWGDKIYVRNQGQQVISGTTTLAKDTEITVMVKNEINPPVFIKSDTTVRPNGNFNIPMDFSEVPAGTELTIEFEELKGSETLYVGSNSTPPEGTTTEPPETPQTTKKPPKTDENRTTTTPPSTTTHKTPSNKTTEDNKGVPTPPRPGQPGFGVPIVIIALAAGLFIFSIRSKSN